MSHSSSEIVALFEAAWKSHQAGDLPVAEMVYRRVLQIAPDHPDGWFFLGLVAQDRGQLAEAEALYRRAIELCPRHAKAWNCLGIVLAQLGKLEHAAASLQRAVGFLPGDAALLSNLGGVLLRQERLDEAIGYFKEALRLKPDCLEANLNLAQALLKSGDCTQIEEAARHFQIALNLEADRATVYHGIGVALLKLRRFDEALAAFDKALAIEPARAQTRVSRALLLLLLGQWQQGWPEYEWRLQTSEFRRHTLPGSPWDGSPLAGRTILLVAERGLGDTIQFVRYAPMVKQRGGRVVLLCQRSMVPLLRTAPSIDHVAADDRPVPGFDVHARLHSLPAIFQTSLTTVPKKVPYLRADARLTEHWRQELASFAGLKVGISWQGNSAFPSDRVRSIPLVHFGALAQVPGVQLISLQKGPGVEQLAALDGKYKVADFGAHLDSSGGAFVDTAALMQSLALVITSDTAIAHLAGALGVAVWVALPHFADWRWMLDRADSPWYPTIRLFRQRQAGDWPEVFARLATELAKTIRDSSADVFWSQYQ